MLRSEKSYMNMKIMKYIGLGLLLLVFSCGGRDRQVEEAYPFRAITVMNLKRC